MNCLRLSTLSAVFTLLSTLGTTGTALAQSVYFVSVNADSGPGSLRQAILDVNAATPLTGLLRHEIRIDVPVVDVVTELPALQNGVWLRPETRPGQTGVTVRGPGTFRLLTVNPGIAAGLAASAVRFEGGFSTGDGGAISASMVVLNKCHFENNRAQRGGAVAAQVVSIDSCSFIDNSAQSEGGAIFLSGGFALNPGDVRIVNSTFDRNQAVIAGGAIWSGNTGGSLILGQLTMTRNAAGNGSAIHAQSAEVRLGNSILHQNSGVPIFAHTQTLVGTNWTAGDPLLAEPASILTFPSLHRYPLPGSPVIDAGTLLSGSDFPLTGNDCRNLARPVGAGVDLGTIESRIFFVTPAFSHLPGGWDNAVDAVNNSQADMISLPAGIHTLTSQHPASIRAAYIYGVPGSTVIDGANQFRPIDSNVALYIRHVEFRNGRFTGPSNFGGAIRIRANPEITTIIEDCHFIDNTNLGPGGAISVDNSPVVIRRSAFIGNGGPSQGGAIMIYKGNVHIENSTFYNNRSAFHGSAIENQEGIVTLIHCTIDSNTSTGNTGAGVQCINSAGRLRLYNTVLSRNTNSTGSSNVNGASAAELTVQGCYIGDSPGLGALVYPGGTTPAYLPPLRINQLVDLGDSQVASTQDQRGLRRPEHGFPDVGAIEVYADPYRALLSTARSASAMADLRERDNDWGATADSDGDGATNVMEVFLDGDPWNAAVTPSLEFVRHPSGLRLGVLRRDGLSGLNWSVNFQSAPELSGPWTTLPVGGIVFDPSSGGFTPVRLFVPTASPRQMFRATLPDIRMVDPLLTAVGLPGNVADPANGRGAVSTVFLIGRYEVTALDYCSFLNAVDPNGTNSLELWRSTMETEFQGSIRRVLSASAGDRYQVLPNRKQFPANFITYYNALRYCNWLHNGAAAGSDTESGAYTLTGASPTPTNAGAISRNASARYFLPNGNEWYKAAYFLNDTAPGGLGAYTDYPNRNHTINNLLPPGDGRSANYRGSSFFGVLAACGVYTATLSAWGCYDQAGNVREMVELPVVNASSLQVAGGGFGDGNASAALRLNFGLDTIGLLEPRSDVGFRIAARPH